MVVKINVPDRTCNWVKFINDNRLSGIYPGKVIIDFSNADFLEPFHITSIACLIEEYHIAGCKIEFVIPNGKVGKYLYNIRFNEYWESEFDRNAYTETLKQTTLCLWKVDKQLIGQYSISASEYYRNNYFVDSNLDMVSISLGEIFNNIYDHSKSAVTGYVLTQYYPKLNQLQTCICDFGVGIPTSLNEYNKMKGKLEFPDNKALEEAFKWGVSSLSKPHNRGFGLDTLRSCIVNNKGSLKFLSNFAQYELNQNGENSYNKNICFPGTLIVIKLDTNNLPKYDLVQISKMGDEPDTFFL